jgi:hypothetical protein
MSSTFSLSTLVSANELYSPNNKTELEILKLLMDVYPRGKTTHITTSNDTLGNRIRTYVIADTFQFCSDSAISKLCDQIKKDFPKVALSFHDRVLTLIFHPETNEEPSPVTHGLVPIQDCPEPMGIKRDPNKPTDEEVTQKVKSKTTRTPKRKMIKIITDSWCTHIIPEETIINALRIEILSLENEPCILKITAPDNNEVLSLHFDDHPKAEGVLLKLQRTYFRTKVFS